MWKDNLENAEQKFGSRTLLTEAAAIYKKLSRDVKQATLLTTGEAVYDEYGMVAIQTPTHFLVAKKNPYGDIVSVHKWIWDHAIAEGKKILMYIQSNTAFYEFVPTNIQKTALNKRGETLMVNFSIRQGINIVKKAQFLTLSVLKKIEEVSPQIPLL